MKYALSIFVLFFFAVISTEASARTIKSFKDSEAITTIAQFMYDVGEDIPVSSRLSDKKINIRDYSKCTDVNAADVLEDVEQSIKRVLRYYPDEEVPFEEALIDLTDYLDNKSFKKCLFEKRSSNFRTKSSYYVDATDRIHVRVDNVALTSEQN